MSEGLICPLTLSSDLVKSCRRGGCAWWDDGRGCCGVLPRGDDEPEARYWLTPKGWAAVERLRGRNGARKLVECWRS